MSMQQFASYRLTKFIFVGVIFSLLFSCKTNQVDDKFPHPINNPESDLMLYGDWVPKDVQNIDFSNLPRIESVHIIVNNAAPHDGVNQHNYLAFFNNKFWIMWSDGPGVEDRVGQRVAFSTSVDGLKWSKAKFITPYPPSSDPSSKYFNTRSSLGHRYISRGFWNRGGELLALVALDEADKFFGTGLKLLAYRLDIETEVWEEVGVVYENAINNFPPKKLPSGEWMMTRRTHDRDVHILTGGTNGYDSWNSYPVINYSDENLKAEEPYWWILPDKNLLALFRDNSGSGYLYRSFSKDNGRTWSKVVRTNFPDARSKFNGLRLNDGRYVLVSNPNPKKRDPLTISVSKDGMVFSRMFYLFGGRRIDYPHIIEHDDFILVAFSGNKQSIEVLKIRTDDLNDLDMSTYKNPT